MIDAVVTKFGPPACRSAATCPPRRLHRHRDCGEAAARIAWAVSDKTIGMVTGEVGTGKMVAIRSAVADLDPASHTVIYIGNPATGVSGTSRSSSWPAAQARPRHRRPCCPSLERPGRRGSRAGRTPVLIIDEAHLLDHDQLESIDA